ncbi:43kDa postsynaptic protein [Trema orientale]|uniref:RING-type E3 ubiquitin transferase n=1 Tax=Trema orientale TaxID=63057 RepID=A0A2P5F785_TREOI|nr:43kDa postsynaptic protein [Trema orientale]
MVLNKDRYHEEWLFLIFQQLCRKEFEAVAVETRVRIEIPATKPVVNRDLRRCPLTGKLKLNVDSSVKSGLGCIEVGAVVKNDDEGSCCFAAREGNKIAHILANLSPPTGETDEQRHLRGQGRHKRSACGSVNVPCSFPFLADQIVISCGRKMWNDRDQGLRYKLLCVKVDIDVLVDVVLPTTASEPFDGEDQTVEIGFVAASKSSIEGLERVRIDDQVVVSCSVCLDDVLVSSEATKLPCSHLFHGQCIVKWLHSSKFCPLCRFELPSI